MNPDKISARLTTNDPSELACNSPEGVAWLGPQLRASNEALPRARVARARGTNQATPPLLAVFFSILLVRHLAFLKQLIQYHISLFWIFVVLQRLGEIVQCALALSLL